MKRLLISFFLIFSVGCNEQQLTKPLGPRNPDTPEKARISQAQTATDMKLPKQLTIKLPYSDITHNDITIDFMLIPAGTFHMGSPETEKSSWGCEEPLHSVTISKPFYMGKYEVTQSQYNEVMSIQKPSQPPIIKWKLPAFRGGNDLPMESVTWFDCVYFTQTLSKQFNAVFRLPTEAEWEYACRAGTTTPFYTGETISAEQANYYATKVYGEGSKGSYVGMTTKIGSYLPNAFGLYDMHGNVSEWCSDWYGSKYYMDSPAIDPKGPLSGKYRVIRGGAWDQKPKILRSAYRGDESGYYYSSYIGFRVVLEVNDVSTIYSMIYQRLKNPK